MFNSVVDVVLDGAADDGRALKFPGAGNLNAPSGVIT